MRNRNLFLVAVLVLAVAFAAGCGKRTLTKGEEDRFGAIAAKIAEAERIGPPDCLDPKLHARAKVDLEHARHEAEEPWGRDHATEAIKAAEDSANALLAATKKCVDARKPKETPAPPPPAPAPPEPAPPPPAPPPAVEPKAELEPIYFDFDKSFIRDDAKPALQKTADYLKKNRDAKIQIQGNCDERGTSEYNMALGDRRATSAKKYLVGLGVDGNRISTVSYGKEKPICTEQNEGCWQKNRRDDFVLQK